MVIKRTFKEWWNDLPQYLKEESKKVQDKEVDKYNKSIKKINYILIEINSSINSNNSNINNCNIPTLDEFKHWFHSGQLFD